MAFHAHSNFGYATVLIAPVPATTGNSLTVGAGEGALFPAAPFNCTLWPPGVNPLAANAEIVTVTAVVGDTLTITRAQEGTTAKSVEAGWQIANTTSVKVFTDIEAAINISAGTTNAPGPFVFADGNGVTFGMDNGTVTASVAPPAAASVNFSAGTTSNNLASITFANTAGIVGLNGITFGLDNGTITAGAGGLTISAGTNERQAGYVVFSAANGITFGLDNLGIMTASHDGLTSQSNQAASASNGSFTFQTLSFTNAFNVTFGTSVGGIIFASVNTAAAGNSVNFSAGTQSSNLASVVFSDSNGIQFGLSNGTITAAHTAALTSQSNQNVTAANGGFAFQTLSFSDANGISFITSAGSAIAASHNALTSQSNQAASASNGSFAFQTINFSDANGVTFGTSAGSIITASVNTAGGAGTASIFFPWQEHLVAIGGFVSNSASIAMLQIPNNISFTRIAVPINISVTTANNNSTGGINFSITAVLHTLNGATLNSVLSTTGSTGMTVSSNVTAAVTGAFFLPVAFNGSLSPGNYWLALQIQSANTGGVITGANTTALAWTQSMSGVGTAAFVSAAAIREFQVVAANSHGWLPHVGLYASTTNLTQIAVADIVASASQNRAMVGLKFHAI